MANEIEAIATNNYVLATQQAVTHDNSMTGNGTVDSPLGVVPGYNETVLWSGTCTSGQSATLSENIGNFEQINVYAYSHNGSPYRGIIQFDTDGNNQIYGACNATWQSNAEYSILMATCSGNKVKAMGSVIIYNGSNIGQNETIYKVIGINRKAQ